MFEEPVVNFGLMSVGGAAEVQRWAAAASAFVEHIACQRAGGEQATVRSIAHCGKGRGVVAYSMLGAFCQSTGSLSCPA